LLIISCIASSKLSSSWAFFTSTNHGGHNEAFQSMQSPFSGIG
jgi:hypothetical protein